MSITPEAENNETTNKIKHKSSYSDLVNIWTGYIGAQHTLFVGYLAAHSFIVAAAVLLALKTYGLYMEGKEVILLVIYTGVFAFVGSILSIQFALSWSRSIGISALIEKHMIELESCYNFQGPKYFTSLESVLKRKVDKTIPFNYSPTRGIRLGRKWWARRAHTVPWLLLTLYLLIFAFAVIKGCQITLLN